jgi:hypothetical protein
VGDTINRIKEAAEFRVVQGGQKLAGLLIFNTIFYPGRGLHRRLGDFFRQHGAGVCQKPSAWSRLLGWQCIGSFAAVRRGGRIPGRLRVPVLHRY